MCVERERERETEYMYIHIQIHMYAICMYTYVSVCEKAHRKIDWFIAIRVPTCMLLGLLHIAIHRYILRWACLFANTGII